MALAAPVCGPPQIAYTADRRPVHVRTSAGQDWRDIVALL